METIYLKAITAVRDGAKFDVNFNWKSLKINGAYIIKNGEFSGELGVTPASEDEVLSEIERLYDQYAHSIPSERSMSKTRIYFQALPEEQLDNDDMLYGIGREEAQIALELYVLCQLINGFKWNAETMGSWFWQSKKHNSLIILRQWFESINNQSVNF